MLAAGATPLEAAFIANLAAGIEVGKVGAASVSATELVEYFDAHIVGLTATPADFPGLTAHPAYEQFKAMTLKQLQPFSNGVITDDLLVKAGTDLAAIK